MPVADAVRISIGIPFVFKPIRIQKGDPLTADHPELIGCWVDGGLLNNIPFREFDDRPGPNPKTLALRLEIEPTAADIESMGNFLSSYLTLALGAGRVLHHGVPRIPSDSARYDGPLPARFRPQAVGRPDGRRRRIQERQCLL